jgi:hypothetical protein
VTSLGAALKELAAQLTYAPAAGLTLSAGSEARVLGHRDAALLGLRQHFYSRYFSRWQPLAHQRTRYSDRASGEPAFVAALTAAAHGASCWEPGWRVVKSDPSWAFVSNGRLNVFVDDRCQLEPSGALDGAAVQVRLPCARENLAPGFFYLFGRAGPIDRLAGHLKLYLNLAPAGAAPLVEALSRGPRLEALKFEAKLANSPAAYCRVDTALVYVEPDSYAGLLSFLRGVRRSHPAWWREGTPMFTRALGTGLAMAEVPPGLPAESFGRHRCRLVAEEVLSALEEGDGASASWLVRVAARFAREGLELPPDERPRRAQKTRG